MLLLIRFLLENDRFELWSNFYLTIDFLVIYSLGFCISLFFHRRYFYKHFNKFILKYIPKEIFLKANRSFVINTKKIIDIQDNSVLIGKDVIPVSRSNRSELMRRLNLL